MHQTAPGHLIHGLDDVRGRRLELDGKGAVGGVPVGLEEQPFDQAGLLERDPSFKYRSTEARSVVFLYGDVGLDMRHDMASDGPRADLTGCLKALVICRAFVAAPGVLVVFEDISTCSARSITASTMARCSDVMLASY